MRGSVHIAAKIAARSSKRIDSPTPRAGVPRNKKKKSSKKGGLTALHIGFLFIIFVLASLPYLNSHATEHHISLFGRGSSPEVRLRRETIIQSVIADHYLHRVCNCLNV